MNHTARRVAFAAGAAFGPLAAIAACIADLPRDLPPPAPAPGCGDGYIDLTQGEQCDPGVLAGEAGVAGCTSNCRVECPFGLVWQKNNHCYQLTTNATSLDPEAKTRCSDVGGHVVTFASEDEFRATADWVQATDAGAFWVGLVQAAQAPRPLVSIVEREPGWSPGCSGCYAHTEDAGVVLPRLLGPSPDGGPAPSQQCVIAESNTARYGSWFQSVCAGAPRIRTVCEREPVGNQWSIDAGLVFIDLVATHGAKRYAYQEAPTTAEDAERDCKSMGGRLVVLQSRDEREQLWYQLGLLANRAPSRIWIGLSQAADAGDAAAPWVWDDGTPADDPDAYAAPWGYAQPAQHPTTSRAYLRYIGSTVDDTLAHNDDSQVTVLPYVCEITGL